jgi:hypothetical protein
MAASTTSRVTTDHDQILCWAEKRGAKPAAAGNVKREEDAAIIGLSFPGDRAPQEIGWPEWFQQFEQHKLALLYQEELIHGEVSNFHQLISRKVAVEVEDAVGGRGRSAVCKDSPGAKPAADAKKPGKKKVQGEGRAATVKKPVSVRGRSSSTGRASPRSPRQPE